MNDMVNIPSQELSHQRPVFTVVALGSAGDINPLFAIALELRKRGHDVLFLSTSEMAARSSEQGLAFAPICSPEDVERTLSHPRLWEARAGLGVLWRYLGVPALRPTITQLQARFTSAPNANHVVLASALAMGARIARELSSFHLVTAYTSPANLRQVEGPFFIGDIAVPTWLPRPLKNLGWKMLDRYKLDPMMRKGLESVRQEWQLPALEGSYLERWMHSPDTGIALWPSWFDNTKHIGQYQAPLQTGFIFLDSPNEACAPLTKSEALSPTIEAFLKDGLPPLVWMPGSAMRKPQQFFDHAIKVSASLKCRAILLTSDASYAPKHLPKDCLVHPLVSFAHLLTRCQALVHHGGIGSAAAAIRAGIPQLIIASAFDQFFNGHRIETLKLGAWCKSKDADPNTLKTKLQAALNLPKQNLVLSQDSVIHNDGLDNTILALIEITTR